LEPHFEGKAGRIGVIGRTIGKIACGFITLSIVTIALSLTMAQFAIECLRRSIQQGVGDFGSEF